VEKHLDEQALRQLLLAGRGLVSELDPDRVLGRVLEVAMEITGARYAALGVLNRERTALERFISRGVDEATRERIGDPPTGRGVLGVLIDESRPLRLADVSAAPKSFGFPAHHPTMRTFLGVPIEIGGEPWGNLYLTEKAGGAEFDQADEEAVGVLGEWAAIAIGNARSVAAERLRLSMEAAEQERMQWARELHDETLQGLAATRLMLVTATRRAGGSVPEGIDRAIKQVDHEIAALRALISDLRPDSLDQHGIAAALRGLAERVESRVSGVQIEVLVGLPSRGRPPRALEVAIYRVAQESITNALRHGGAGRLEITLEKSNTTYELTVIDDGSGFDPERTEFGFGIMGMRERAELAGGTLVIDAASGRSTRVVLRIPVGGLETAD
jgi:signal transduction histidine kinase